MKINASELGELLDFASSRGLSLNLIELIPLGTPKNVYDKEYVALSEVERFVESRSVKKYVKDFQNRPTYVLDSGIEVTLVRGYGNPYLCAGCTRLRLTPSGRVKTCIYREDSYVDAKDAIKSRDEPLLTEALRRATLLREPYFR